MHLSKERQGKEILKDRGKEIGTGKEKEKEDKENAGTAGSRVIRHGNVGLKGKEKVKDVTLAENHDIRHGSAGKERGRQKGISRVRQTPKGTVREYHKHPKE